MTDTIGFIGLGVMGAGMAKNILKAGFKLVATTSSRDAIGARVTVSDGDWRRVHFLTAGDGYMASNQRQLVIGLGDRKRVPMLRVDWPSGASTVLRDVEAGGEVVIVEGRAAAIRLPRAD